MLPIKTSCDLVSLGHIQLDGCVVCGTNDAVACGTFLRHIQVRELASIILHVRLCLLDGSAGVQKVSFYSLKILRILKIICLYVLLFIGI